MSLFDTMYLMLVFFVIAIAVVVMHFASTGVLNVFRTVPTVANNTDFNNTLNNIQGGFNAFDWIIAMFFFGSVLYILFSSFLFESHPFFLMLSILFMIVVIWMSPYISNAFGSFIENPTFNSTVSAFPITMWIMQNLPIIMLGVTFLTIILSVAKPVQTR